MAEALPGGWSGWNFEITQKEKGIFEEALKGLLGVRYRPLAVATQVVAGTNYGFLAEGIGVYPGALTCIYVVNIFAPLPGQGTPHVTGIVKVNP